MISKIISICEHTLLTDRGCIARKRQTITDARERLREIRLTCILEQTKPRVSDKESSSERWEGGSTRSQNPHNPMERQGVKFQKEKAT